MGVSGLLPLKRVTPLVPVGESVSSDVRCPRLKCDCPAVSPFVAPRDPGFSALGVSYSNRGRAQRRGRKERTRLRGVHAPP